MPGIANLVEQTSTTTGTGNMALTPVDGRQEFDDIAEATFFYAAFNGAADEWEIGITGLLSGELDRASATIIASSNVVSGVAELVSFSAGTKTIVSDIPQEYLPAWYKQDAEPTNPRDWDVWTDTVDYATYIYSNDGNSKQWVQIAGAYGGSPNIWYDDVDGNGYSLINHLGTLTNTSTKETALENSSGDQVTPENQIHGTSYAQATQSVTRWSNSENPSYLILSKSRGATVGTHGAVSDNDYLGRISFCADDGTNWVPGGEIRMRVDGTPGSEDMPARMEFLTTADGAATCTVRATIAQDGGMWIGSTADQSQGSGTLNAENGVYDNGYYIAGWHLLNSGSVSAAATLDIALDTFTEYNMFIIVVDDVVPSVDGEGFVSRLSDDGGATFESGATYYAYGRTGIKETSVSSDGGSTANSEIFMFQNAGSGTAESVSGVVEIIRPDEATNNCTMLSWRLWGEDAASDASFYTGSARVAGGVTADHTDIQFKFDTGNITRMNWKLYGVM